MKNYLFPHNSNTRSVGGYVVNTTHWKYIRAGVFISSFFLFLCTVIILIVFLFAKFMGPPEVSVPETTVFYDSENNKIGEVSAGGERHWVPLEDISTNLIDATLAIEDQSFYDHYGFDIRRLFGAIIADIKAMAKVQGASTITQQYAKNLYLTQEKTFMRKLVEAWYTIRLEVNYSKDEILEGYLNTIYYGHGAYGIEAASQFYFGKTAKDLTLGEASMLAGIPKGPSYYSPYNNKEKAISRQQLILATMKKQEMISEEAYTKSLEEPLNLQPFEKEDSKTVAPYFQDEVKKELEVKAHISKELIEKGGLRVYTTLDKKIQEAAEKQVAATIPDSTDIEAALVAMNPKTGEVKALIGGRNYVKSPFNRATQAQRQPGSTFKPFLYYAALQDGFTPTTQLKSEYTSFSYGGSQTYTPENYHGYYANDFITMAQALAVSDNIYAVKTHLFLGEEALFKTAKEFGISTELDKVPSLALGASPVKPIEMVNAYGIIANGGKEITPTFVKRVVDAQGHVLYDANLDSEQILDKDTAFVLTDMMTGMFDSSLNGYTSVTGQSIADNLTRPYAGKSGSTNADSWMIGFTPQLVTGVWIGYDQGKTIEEKAEQRYSKSIWAGFMETALQDTPVKQFQPTQNVIGVSVNPETGKLADESCPVSRFTYFIKGTEPTEYCTSEKKDTEMEKKEEKKEKKWYERWFPF